MYRDIDVKNVSIDKLSQVNIPVVLDNINLENLKSLPVIDLQTAKIVEGKLIFDEGCSVYQAMTDGFFYLKIPENINLESGYKFCRNFYKNKNNSKEDPYKGFKNFKKDDLCQGYFDNEYDQWEQFFLISHNWKRFLPIELNMLGIKLEKLGIDILKSILETIGVPQSYWKKGTGGLTEYLGFTFLGFSHFRSQKKGLRGSKFHRDLGWITILASNKPGLVTILNDTIFAINPKDNYFIINFGSTMEVFTQKTNTPIRANVHGVISMNNSTEEDDRVSFVTLFDSNFKENVYQYQDNQLFFIETMQEFVDREIERTYSYNNKL